MTNNANPKLLQIPKDHNVYIYRRFKEDYGKFQMIDHLTTTGDIDFREDIFDILATVSQSVTVTFNELKKRRNPHNSLCHVPAKGFTKSQRTIFNRNVRKLINRGVVKKVPVKSNMPDTFRYNISRGTYMINPYLIKCIDYSEATFLWDHLSPSKYS